MKTEDAVGQVLCHDITQIIRGERKGPVFRKGHVIREEDIPVLLSVGKDHVYIWENNENMLHENDAAQILYELCRNDFMHPSEPKEGKIDLYSDINGLFKVDQKKLYAVNSLGEMMIACRHGNFPVKKNDHLAGTRIIPLVIEKQKMERAREAAAGGKIFSVLPFRHKKAGLLTTGNEVYYNRIRDTFLPVLDEKLSEYSVEVIGREKCPDDPAVITGTIMKFIEAGAELVLCAGGMSVDPDDRTPLAIRNTGAAVVTYGSPVLPGAMFMLAYYGKKKIPVCGLPGCVMYSKRTVFDLVLPRLMADDPVTKAELDALGEGGLCLSCKVCTFPNCGFGK